MMSKELSQEEWLSRTKRIHDELPQPILDMVMRDPTVSRIIEIATRDNMTLIDILTNIAVFKSSQAESTTDLLLHKQMTRTRPIMWRGPQCFCGASLDQNGQCPKEQHEGKEPLGLPPEAAIRWPPEPKRFRITPKTAQIITDHFCKSKRIRTIETEFTLSDVLYMTVELEFKKIYYWVDDEKSDDEQ